MYITFPAKIKALRHHRNNAPVHGRRKPHKPVNAQVKSRHRQGQSPPPGLGVKYFSNLSGTPSNSLASDGGSFLTVIFGHTLAYSAFTDSHFSRPGSVSGFIASIGHS